jgi:CHAT domain-containing protein
MRPKWVVCLICLIVTAGCASESGRLPPEKVAEIRAMEAESAARLTIEGEILYGADTKKRNGYEYCTLSYNLSDQGELRQAIRMASKALYLGQIGRDPCLVALAKRDLAIAYSFAGHLDRAKQLATEALQGASNCRTTPIITAFASKVLGDVALRRGLAKEAVPRYERALAESPARQQPLFRAALANALLAAGDSGRARSLFQEAERQADAEVKPLIRRGLGQVALAEGKIADALLLFEEAAATASGPDAAYYRLWALEGLARARLAAGDRAGAVAAYQKAMTTAEEVRARFRSEEFRAGFFGNVQQVFDGAVATFVDAGQGEAALEVSERSRARAFQDLVRGRITGKAGSEVLVGATSAPPTPVREIASRLPEGTVLVEYHLSEQRLFAWVIRRSGVRTVPLAVGPAAVADETGRFRRSVRTRGGATNALGEALYGKLIQPLDLSDGEALVIVPHGTLHYLPFQALRGPRGYLVEERAISYAPSAGVLGDLLGKERADRRSVLALGNPDLGSTRLALPGAEREVQQIKTLFPQAEVYLGKEATKEHLVGRAPQSDIVHVGAHAEVDEVDPLYSVIRLVGNGGQSGELEAHEVYEMDLSRVGLVALSACDTGLGKVSQGDELWGFTRSFFAAGTRGMVVSLWPVDDVSTSLLMGKFYEGLREGDPQQSLRSAQLDVMHSGQHQEPYFWAAFGMIGDWR